MTKMVGYMIYRSHLHDTDRDRVEVVILIGLPHAHTVKKHGTKEENQVEDAKA